MAWNGTSAVLNTRIFTGREENKDLRQSLDPEDELLCMLSPLQVIYALESFRQKTPQNFLKVDKFN
ncbi:hypothetical protein HADU_10781 [Acinetobacter sp. HA]|uniref:Uncharacterized protein n=1 Tax=Acinetobacter schindleri TaxID=108981 RepID=A0A2S1FGS3_9GAMM|nr:hypothetical protein C0119_02585 [Acinetobacter schindleri]EIM38730.1 hypothetical protein HADU_10781 [Acinetobacter sp. HA]POU25531.1 hypothetical protein C3420_05380 [Acinetobacter sp. ACNIH3]POV79501.1 hypothetical protein C3421_03745 [Acinetobacter sp. ACNIH4]RAZ05903.1 hypothetical protein C8322_04125 [Acinetobacter sp. SM1B]